METARTCISCGSAPGIHSVVDEHGSTPTCALCLIAVVGDHRPNVTLSVVVSRAQPDHTEGATHR